MYLFITLMAKFFLYLSYCGLIACLFCFLLLFYFKIMYILDKKYNFKCIKRRIKEYFKFKDYQKK